MAAATTVWGATARLLYRPSAPVQSRPLLVIRTSPPVAGVLLPAAVHTTVTLGVVASQTPTARPPPVA
jgi:hypothetical protein